MEAVRLDELTDFDATAYSDSQGETEYWGTIIHSMFVKQDTGIVAHTLEVDIEGRGYFSDHNSNYLSEFTINLESEVKLKSISLSPNQLMD
jgi:hypothetical protein